MTVFKDKDIKVLWAKAAGLCSKPGCNEECVKYYTDTGENIVLGEMAHIIAHSPDGPRGDGVGKNDTYENLILLCPTHHNEIDKNPEAFPHEMLNDWKKEHEKRIKDALKKEISILSYTELCQRISRLLMENEVCWKTYGPESNEARRNPISNMSKIWDLRKLSTIIPNNRLIIELINTNKNEIPSTHFEAFVKFIEHSEGFEKNCFIRTEGIPKFPKEFKEILNETAGR